MGRAGKAELKSLRDTERPKKARNGHPVYLIPNP